MLYGNGRILLRKRIILIWQKKDFIKKKGIMILKFNIKDFMYLYMCGRILFRKRNILFRTQRRILFRKARKQELTNINMG